MKSVRTRNVLLATVVLAVMISPFAVAASGPILKLNGRNPTSHSETQIVGRINGTDNNTGGYTTRQSNLSSTGGGAFYGCRAAAAAQNGPAVEPCMRANNLSTGLAFEFNTTHGTSAGSITVGSGGDATKPFTTNATGVATGLNADRVDGKDGADIANAGDFLSARVTAAGTLAGGRGATAAAIETGPKTYRVTFGRDVSNCTYTATPQGAATSNTLAVQAGSNPQNVRVDADAATPFQLIVVC